MSGGFKLAGNYQFSDHFGNIRPNHVGAQQLPVLGIEDEFNEAIFVPTGACFSGGTEGEFTHFEFVACFLSGLLGHADRGNFRLAIGATRYVAVVQRFRMMAGDFFYTNNAFGRSNVRQGRAFDHIANGIVAFGGGSVEVIHLNFAFVESDTAGFQPDVFDVRNNTCSAQHHFGFEGLHTGWCFDLNLASCTGGIHRLDR